MTAHSASVLAVHDGLMEAGFPVWPGDLGERITTRGIGQVQPGESIWVEPPAGTPRPLEPV